MHHANQISSPWVDPSRKRIVIQARTVTSHGHRGHIETLGSGRFISNGSDFGEGYDTVTSPRMASDQTGRVIVAWRTNQPAGDGAVMIRSRMPRGRWGPVQVLSDHHGVGEGPAVAMNDRGDAAVSWANDRVLVQFRPRFGRFARVRRLTARGQFIELGSLAMDNHRRVAVIWRVYRPGRTVSFVSARWATGAASVFTGSASQPQTSPPSRLLVPATGSAYSWASKTPMDSPGASQRAHPVGLCPPRWWSHADLGSANRHPAERAASTT